MRELSVSLCCMLSRPVEILVYFDRVLGRRDRGKEAREIDRVVSDRKGSCGIINS